MEKEQCFLAEKLVIVLKKITESHFKIADDSYFEKILKNITEELDKNGAKHFQVELFIKWFEGTIKIWEETPPDATVAGFVIRFIGVFCRSEREFQIIQKQSILDDLLHCIDLEVIGSSPLKMSYITLLSYVISHESGYEWINYNKFWKSVVKMCLSNSSIYVEREAAHFITKLFVKNVENNEFYEEILKDVLLPIITCEQLTPPSNADFDTIICFEEKLMKKISPSLKLLCAILDVSLTSPHTTIPCLLLHTFEIEPKLKTLMETCQTESLLDTIVTTYTTILVACSDMKDRQSFKQRLPSDVIEVFKLLIRRHKINNTIKLAKSCQLLWSKLGLAQSEDEEDTDTEIHLIIIEMIPLILFIKRTNPINSFLDMYVDKLYHLTDEQVQRLAYAFRDVIKEETDCPIDYSLKSALSLSKNVEKLSMKRAVILFQALAYVFKEFVPRVCLEDEPITDEEFHQAQLLCSTGATFLSSILNALCIIIEKFRINWKESLESLCLLKFTTALLDNPNLSPLLGVQTLMLLKLAIMNFMSPSLALLLNKNTCNFEYLTPLLYKKLHDPNWEIRDSCIEVITVVAELAEIKYPAFQELLSEKNFPSLMLAMMEGDAESYVKASALRAISAMTKVDKLWNDHLNDLNIPEKVIHILRNESEGIVRREAALVMKAIYESRPIRVDLLQSIYQVMAYSATHDLHWEVKVNCLMFWEKVIQHLMADQGMIDGSFPNVTFSKQHKKIVTLNGEEIKIRLNKVLDNLSKINCLHVLMTTLNDDCDFQVVQKSAQIIKDFLSILKRYEIIVSTNSNSCDKNSQKRKTSDESCCEKRKTIHRSNSPNPQNRKYENNADDDIGAKSDKVIEDIVNEMDINLLVSVCNPEPNGLVKVNGELLNSFIKPAFFLDKLQYFDFHNFLEEKSKWLMNSGNNLDTLLDDILSIHSHCETNALDCY